MDTLTLFLTLIAASLIVTAVTHATHRLWTWGWNWKTAWEYGNRDLLFNDRMVVAILWLAAWGFAL